MKDDLFELSGITWQRQWVGDNGGRYEWVSDDGRLVVWCSHRRFDVDAYGNKRAVHEYSATLDGYAATKVWPTLTSAMEVARSSRNAWDRKHHVGRTGEHA